MTTNEEKTMDVNEMSLTELLAEHERLVRQIEDLLRQVTEED